MQLGYCIFIQTCIDMCQYANVSNFSGFLCIVMKIFVEMAFSEGNYCSAISKHFLFYFNRIYALPSCSFPVEICLAPCYFATLSFKIGMEGPQTGKHIKKNFLHILLFCKQTYITLQKKSLSVHRKIPLAVIVVDCQMEQKNMVLQVL